MHFSLLSSGVQLGVLPVDGIGEWSNMTRQLCVELLSFGEGLQREVPVDLVYISDEGFSSRSKST